MRIRGARGFYVQVWGTGSGAQRVPHVILVRGAARSSSPAIRRAGVGCSGCGVCVSVHEFRFADAVCDSRRAGFPCAGLGRGVWFVPFHMRAAAYRFCGISARHKNNNGVRDHGPKAAPQWKCSVSGEAGFQKRPEFPDTAAIQPKPCGTFGVLSNSHFYGYLSAEAEKVRLQRKTGQVFFEPADRSLFEKFGSFRCI